MSEFMLLNGKAVQVKPIAKEKFDSLQLDAKRILGLAPAKPKITVNSEIAPIPVYLDPPAEGSDIWNWAQKILALEWPAVRVWRVDIGPEFVNKSDLEEIQ